MRWIRGLAIAVGLVMLSGCASTAAELQAEQEQKDADIWAAMGYEGSPPPHSAADIHQAVSEITDRSERIIWEGSAAQDCEPYMDAFKVLVLADFEDSRQDYMAPLMNSLSQVYSGCNDRGTWEGVVDDVLDVSELGAEYVARF